MLNYLKKFEQVVTTLLIVMMSAVVALSVAELGWVLVKDVISAPVVFLDINETKLSPGGTRRTHERLGRASLSRIATPPAQRDARAGGCPAERRLDPHELADVLHRDEADESTLMDHRNGVAFAGLQSGECGLDHLGRINDADVAAHDEPHQGGRAPLCERREQITSHEHSYDPAILEHGEILLPAGERQVDGAGHRVLGRERTEVP